MTGYGAYPSRASPIATQPMIHLGLAAIAVLAQASQTQSAATFLEHACDAQHALASGDLAQAEQSFQLALALDPKNASVAYGMACVSARRSALDMSMSWLVKAFDVGYRDAAVMEWDADLTPLRARPDFLTLAAAMRSEVAKSAKPVEPPPALELKTDDDFWCYGPHVGVASQVGALACTDGTVRLVDLSNGIQIGVVQASKGPHR